MSTDLKKIIIYHASCSDGFCAAWLCQKVIDKGDTQYYAFNYSDSPDKLIQFIHSCIVANNSVTANIELYIVDFSFSEEILKILANLCSKVVVLDHHKTASHIVNLIDSNVIAGYFDINRSGAKLTAEWFTNTIDYYFDNNVRDIVDYVEDRDLWKFKLPQSRDVNSAIRSYDYTFDEWDKLSSIGVEQLVAEGQAINRYRDKIISQHVENSYIINMTGENILTVDCSCSEIISDVGEALCKLSNSGPYSLVTSKDNVKGIVKCSLRSLNNSNVDVSLIAKKFGGGGHKHAAGYTYKL
jgi:oligoribonuclease NrnB/cAMP/cGMP phosphodiesterase (DHH superfamily)